MDQRIIDLYDAYTHGHMDRRQFMERLAVVTGSAAAALALLPQLQNSYAHAETVAPTDPRLTAESMDFAAGATRLTGYLARPAGDRPAPAVVVLHENRGLNPHIRDVARRFAVEGFVALAPDLLSPLGGTPEDEDQARELLSKLTPEQALDWSVAAVAAVRTRPGVTGKVGAVGFCWGGGLVNRLAAEDPTLGAVVSYYGRQIPSAEVSGIRAPLLLHYAGLDQGINRGIPAFEEALKETEKTYTLYMYEGVNHAFNNDTNPARYDRAAAELSWRRTVDFLRQHLAAT